MKSVVKYAMGYLFLSAASLAGAGSGPAARPAITGIAHAVLYDQSLDQARSFYIDLLGWPELPPIEAAGGFRAQVGPRQYLEVMQPPAGASPTRHWSHLAFATTDAGAMRRYLAANGVAVPAAVGRRRDGSRFFVVDDPEGNRIEFVQAVPARLPQPRPAPVSTQILHAGFGVHTRAAEDHFYKDLLGFHLYWEGWQKDDGHQTGEYDYVSMQVPDGTDWLEYMLHAPQVSLHVSPGVVNLDEAQKILESRNWRPGGRSKIQMGRDGKRQLNLFDPAGTRVELMEFQPSGAVCCAPYTGAQPKP